MAEAMDTEAMSDERQLMRRDLALNSELYDAVLHPGGQGRPKRRPQLVIIQVGETQFNVPVAALTKNSCRFRTNIHDQGHDNKTYTIELETTDVDSVHLFANWIQGQSPLNEDAFLDLNAFNYEALFKAYIFGDYIQALPFQNIIMDTITAKLRGGHNLEPCLPKLAYQGTPEESRLRRVLVDAYVREGVPFMVLSPAGRPYLEQQFLIDLTAALFCVRDELRGPAPYVEGERYCYRYHNHELEGDQHCYGRKLNIPKAIEDRQDQTSGDPMDHDHADEGSDMAAPNTSEHTPLGPSLCAGPAALPATPASSKRPSAATSTNETPMTTNSGRTQIGSGTVPRTPVSTRKAKPSARPTAHRARTLGREPPIPPSPFSVNAPPTNVKTEPETPCPGPKRRRLAAQGNTADRPIQLD